MTAYKIYSHFKKYIPPQIKRLIEKDKKMPLGRWNNEKTTNQIKTAVDLANVDHCGPCGSDKIDNTNEKKQKTSSYNEDMRYY